VCPTDERQEEERFMPRRQITSREYKMMLRPKHFAGDERQLMRAAHAVWREISRKTARVVPGVDGDYDRIKTRRLITFFDTTQQHLHEAGYIFRERRNLRTEERQVTLKFRHPDRYVSQNRQVDAKDAAGGKEKFEEDVKVPFLSLYSLSNTIGIDHDTRVNDLGEAARMFPGLANRVSGFRDGLALSAVDGFVARELVITGGSLRLGRNPDVDAESALIVWYDNARRSTKPVAVELSYRYGDDNEEYEGTTALRAYDVFDALRTQLSKWVDPNARTKTALVYG
jgi:hypothetical protein